ncbi:MAG: amidohydrolase family protein [Anaerolineae bacterium]
MNIIDINAWLGNYPWRSLTNNKASELVNHMDQVGIGQAVVSSIEAVFYNNPQPGNAQLYQDSLEFRDRLIPFATINPTYAGWEHDLAVCHADWHMQGLRAFPVHHGYALGDKTCEALLAAAAERSLPVVFCVRLADRRQHHWLDSTTDLDPALLAKTLAAHPANHFMVLNSLSPAETWHVLAGRQVLFDISRMTALNISLAPTSFTISAHINSLDAAQLAFGTGMPFSVPQVALLKLQVLRTDDEARTAIAAGNAARMLDGAG